MATSQFLPFAGVSQIPSRPVMRTPLTVPETPFSLICTSLIPSGLPDNVPTTSSPVCPKSVAVISGCETGAGVDVWDEGDVGIGVGVAGVGAGFGAGITGEAATGGVGSGVGAGAGEGFGAGITGEAATGGGAVTGAVPGQALPVLPPQTVLDEAIATIISSGMASAAMLEPAQVKPSRTATITASIAFFMGTSAP